jgi:hypothetical protein
MDEISSYIKIQMYKVIHKRIQVKWGLQEHCGSLCELSLFKNFFKRTFLES